MNTARLTLALRRLVKVLHTVGAAGFMGGMAALGVAIVGAPGVFAGDGYGPAMAVMARITAWLVAPGMILVVVSGLLAMAINPAFYDVGWVWLKAGTGILVLEGGLHVLGPIREGGRPGAAASALLAGEAGTLWVLLGVSAVNVVLGVWRPRLLRLD